MEKCCCCSVRTACLALGVLAMLGSVSQVFKDGKELANHAASDQQQIEAEVDAFYTEMKEVMEIKKDEVRNFFKINVYITITDIILLLGMIGATACLFHGVNSKEDKFLLPIIWFLPLDLLVRCFFVFVLVINFGITSPLSIGLAALFFFVIIYDICFWLCVYSHREQLVASSDDSHRYSAYAAKV